MNEYMGLVSARLRTTQPGVYAAFLKAMVAFDKGNLDPRLCLENVRSIFHAFPDLVEGFETMYRILVEAIEDEGHQSFLGPAPPPSLYDAGPKQASPTADTDEDGPMKRPTHKVYADSAKDMVDDDVVYVDVKPFRKGLLLSGDQESSAQFLNSSLRGPLTAYFCQNKTESSKGKHFDHIKSFLVRMLHAMRKCKFADAFSNPDNLSVRAGVFDEYFRLSSTPAKDLRAFLLHCHDDQARTLLEKEKQAAFAYVSAHGRSFRFPKAQGDLLEDMRLDSCKSAKSVAKQLSVTLDRPCAARKRIFVPTVGTRIPFGRGSGYKYSYYHTAIPTPITAPNPLSSPYIGLTDNYHKDDESVLRYVPYFGDNDEEGIDVSSYDIIPGEEGKQIVHEVDDYMATLITVALACSLHVCGYLHVHTCDESATRVPNLLESFPRVMFDLVGKIMGQFEGKVVFTRVDEILNKDRGLMFLHTGLLECLDEWVEHTQSSRRVERSDQPLLRLPRLHRTVNESNQNYSIHTIVSENHKDENGDREFRARSSSNRSNELKKRVDSRLTAIGHTDPSSCFTNGTISRGLRASPHDHLSESESESKLLTLDGSWMIETYHALFCRRCFKYDCQTHGAGHPLPQEREPEEMCASPAKPCGSHCYISDPRLAAISLPGRGKRKRKSFPNISMADCGLAYRVLRLVRGNTCRAAEILGREWGDTKLDVTCQNIYELMQTRWPGLAEHSIADQKERGKPRKKLKPGAGKKVRREREFLHTSFQPCDHTGPCTVENNCECALRNNYCEKYCACSKACKNRFGGCNCRGQCNTKTCHCWAAHRECDYDVCGNCHINGCSNCNVAQKKHAHLIVGHSSIHGWGCFSKDALKKGAFICSYLGEIISQDEADRRGKIYDKLKCSFLFELNKEYVIDATRKGNKLKYANHSHKHANMSPRVVIHNGDHYVHMYAIRDIERGEELCFDYGYGTDGYGNKWARKATNKYSP